MINISRALTVEGWMTEAELLYLAQAAEKSHQVAEVGSWQGRSTCALAANVAYMVYAIDTWRGSPEHQAGLRGKDEDWIMREFLTNVEPFAGRVAPVRMKSETAAWWLGNKRHLFSMIFLDASHDYASVKADILAWTPLLAAGGILCGHDYDPPNWMGVKQAVDECVPRFRVVPNTTIWTTEGAA